MHLPTRPAIAAGATGRTAGAARLWLLLGPAMLVITVLFVGGLLLGLVQALGWFPGASMALTGEHVHRVLAAPEFFTSLLLTLHVAVTSTVLASVISVLLACALTALAGHSRVIFFLLQLPLAVPHLVIAVSVLLLLSPSGLVSRLLLTVGLIPAAASFPLMVNDRFAIGIIAVYVWKEIPFITFMLLAVLRNTGNELLEVGATLRASRRQRFFHITLPLLTPALGASALIVFAFTFGAFEVPYLLGQTHPLLMPVWSYRSYSDIDLLSRPEGIAIGLIIAVIVVAAVAAAQLILTAARWRGAP